MSIQFTRKPFYAFIALFVILASGCATQTTTPISNAETPAEIAVTDTSIPTVYIIPTVTFTPLPTPTQTQKPTATTVPTDTQTPTPVASPTPKASPTTEASQMTVNTSVYDSPNGKWVMSVRSALPLNEAGELYADYAHDQVTISEPQGTKEWIVIDQWTNAGLGMGGYEPFLWSPNGEYVYITYKPRPDGCGLFVNGSNLLKVNLNTGEKIVIVPDVGLWLSLSPDETSLAYIGFGERGLVIRDLATGNERQVKLTPGKDYMAGHILWSPDGAALVLTLAIQPCSTNWAMSTSVIRIETETLEQRTLIGEDERLFVTLEWPTPEKVVLMDGNGNLWWMNPETGQVMEKH